MKRAIVAAACLSVLYAGVLWALEGCGLVGDAMASGHHEISDVDSDHSRHSDSNHRHSDTDEVHCPNPLAAFILTQRMTLEREQAWTAISSVLADSIASAQLSVPHQFALSPPGLAFSTTPPYFVLHSVLRI